MNNEKLQALIDILKLAIERDRAPKISIEVVIMAIAALEVEREKMI